MIIHLVGPDTFRSQQRFEQLRDAFRKKHDSSGLSTVILDAETATLEMIRSAVLTQGFFSAKRFVGLNHYGPQAVCAPVDLQSALNGLEDRPDVIIVVREIPAASKTAASRSRGARSTVPRMLLKFPAAKVENFARLTSLEARRWLVRAAADRSVAITPAAADQLVLWCGNDLWRLDRELEKLAVRAGTDRITPNLVNELVRAPDVSDIFQLVDALGQRRTADALRLLGRELSAGTHPLAIVALLLNHVRNLRNIQAARRRLAPTAIARELGLHPFVVQKSVDQLKRFDSSQLSTLYRRLLEVDDTAKSARLDPEALLDAVFVRT